jgi:hypothetical protein
MKNNFDKAFDSLTECLTSLGKGVEEMVDGLMTEKKSDGSCIVIKKGSKVFLGKGVYVELLKDVEAKVLDEPPAAEADSPAEESSAKE